MGKPFFAYMLLCSDDSYYVGSTDDLDKRIGDHQSGVGGAYTSKRRPLRLVWSQEFATREEAKQAEAQLKGWSRAKKEAIARGDLAAISSLAKKTDWAAYKERQASAQADDRAD